LGEFNVSFVSKNRLYMQAYLAKGNFVVLKENKMKKPWKRYFPRLFGTHERIRTSDLSLRSMAYHVIHGSDVTSNIIPYAE